MTFDEMIEMLELPTADAEVSIPYAAWKLRQVATKLRAAEELASEAKRVWDLSSECGFDDLEYALNAYERAGVEK